MAAKRKDALIGKKFHATVADASCEFEIVSRTGKICKAVSKEPYEAERFFSVGQVTQALAMEEMFAGNARAQKGFWETVPVGKIIHYYNGFKQYVRGEVILDGGVKKLKPLALVGEWKEYDLPRVTPDGRVEIPYLARKILQPNAESAWQPNVSCIYEAPEFARKGEPAPSSLHPVPLEVPVARGELAALSALNGLRTAAIGMLDKVDRTDKAAILKAFAEVVDLLGEGA